MAGNNKEVTTSFNVDITGLKKGIQDANRQIKLANAEFKAASAGLEDWQKTTEGVSKKLEQLDKVLDGQTKILNSYEQQLEQIVKEQGENSAGADEMRIKIANQQAAVNKTTSEIKKYTDILSELEKEQLDAADTAGKQSNAYDNLKTTIGEQEQTLKDLKDEYANVVLEQGKNSDAAKNLAAQIEDLSGELGDNKKAIKEADDAADELDKSLDDMGDSAEGAGGGFTVLKGALADLVSAGIQKVVDGFKKLTNAAIDAWQEYDKGADSIITATGATGDEAEKLVGVYKNVSKNVVASYSDIGTAVGEVNTRFGVTDDELQDLSEKFLKFANINGIDVKSAIDSTQAAMAAWSVSTKDTGLFLDTLNKAGQDTGVSVDKLAESLLSNAPALQEMGYNSAEAAMFLASLEKNGVDASATMTGMKKALANAAKDGKPLSEAMSDVEKSIIAAKDSTEAITIATDLFGAKAGAAIATAVRDGKLSFEDLNTTMGEFEGNVENTFESTLDAPDKFKLGIQNIRTELANVAGRLMDKYAPQIEKAFDTIINKIIPAIETGVTWLIDNLPSIATAVVGIVSAFAAFKIVGLIQGIVGAIQGWMAATEGMTAAQALLNLAMEANPIGIIIGLITGLVAVFITLWNTSEDFRNFWITLWEDFTKYCSEAWQAITEFFANAWDVIVSVWDGAVDFFKGIIDGIFNYYKFQWDLITGIFKTAWDGIKAVWSVVSTWFNDHVIKPVADLFSGLGTLIPNLLGTAWSGVTAAWSAVASWFNDFVVSPIANLFGSMWQNAVTGAGQAWDGIKTVFSVVSDWFKNTFSLAWQKVKDVFSTGGKIFEGIKDGIVNAFKAVVNAIIRGINKVVAIPFNAINGILNKIRNIGFLGIEPFKGLWPENPFNVPQIPELAKGGVLKKGQLGLLEGKGAEAVIPLENNKKWINATAKALKAALTDEGVIGGTAGGNVTNYNFTQNNTSPKALSRLEIYRQTKNQLSLAKGV